ncbi:hypothetical protein IV454_02525 [Massilia antarctica]|uniref:Uncharacterized protein n=1 Tax=Massilia antarctica TaxID=2765360 RepID=A0AA48WDH4_9BURK|nr:hypothetical protein [Massilia antarctica]QPI50516.1 hypothetical protein IV454_02525 [Massilia antarctica]
MRLMMALAFWAALLCPAIAPHAAAAQGNVRGLARAEKYSATAVAEALARFDSAPAPMNHPRLFGGAADAAGIVAAARAELARGLAGLADYLKRHAVRLAARPARQRQLSLGRRGGHA